jgi:hypothetical protein
MILLGLAVGSCIPVEIIDRLPRPSAWYTLLSVEIVLVLVFGLCLSKYVNCDLFVEVD